jgi:hypothetical protein
LTLHVRTQVEALKQQRGASAVNLVSVKETYYCVKRDPTTVKRDLATRL